jgi:hypothetical protein
LLTVRHGTRIIRENKVTSFEVEVIEWFEDGREAAFFEKFEIERLNPVGNMSKGNFPRL